MFGRPPPIPPSPLTLAEAKAKAELEILDSLQRLEREFQAHGLELDHITISLTKAQVPPEPWRLHGLVLTLEVK